MATSYPDDLRDQVLAFVDEGHSIREAAAKFGVSPSFVSKTHKKRAAANDLPLLDTAGDVETPEKQADDGTISAADLAELFGVSKRAISDFVDRGIVVKTQRNRFDLRRSVQTYCDHLRSVAAGRGGDGSDALTAERARLAREQADATALKNAASRRELISIVEVQQSWVAAGRRIRNALMSVPSRCRQMLPHLTTFDVELIDREIRSALSEIGENDDSAEDTAAVAVGQSPAAAETPPVGLD